MIRCNDQSWVVQTLSPLRGLIGSVCFDGCSTNQFMVAQIRVWSTLTAVCFRPRDFDFSQAQSSRRPIPPLSLSASPGDVEVGCILTLHSSSIHPAPYFILIHCYILSYRIYALLVPLLLRLWWRLQLGPRLLATASKCGNWSNRWTK